MPQPNTVMIDVPYTILESVRAIVEYDYPAEATDYEREGEPEGHVFEHLRSVSEWLTAATGI